MWCVCAFAQLYMDQTKMIFDHFICIWKWFLLLFVFMFSAYFVFHCLSMFCFEKQVSEFSATCFGYLRELLASCQFWRLASHEFKSRVHTEGFRDSLTTRLATRQSRIAQNQLFKELFRGKLVLNLSHPLLNLSFNIFTSKPNQFEWFFIPLTSLR